LRIAHGDSSPSSVDRLRKSTLLNVAAGLLRPASGTVRLFDAPLAGLNREAATCFMADAPVPWKPAIDNVPPSARNQGHTRAEALQRAQAWLTSVGLGAFGNRYPHMLSGGQRPARRLAQVLIRDPKSCCWTSRSARSDAQTREIMGNC